MILTTVLDMMLATALAMKWPTMLPIVLTTALATIVAILVIKLTMMLPTALAMIWATFVNNAFIHSISYNISFHVSYDDRQW